MMPTCGACIYPVFYSRVNCCLDPRNKRKEALVTKTTECFTGGFIESRTSAARKRLNVERAKEALK
jgi:hypothetical protein